MGERELIEAAVAAGRVRVMPPCRGSDDAEALRLAIEDVRSSVFLSLLLLTLQGAERTVGTISFSIRQRHFPPASFLHPTSAQIEQGLKTLQAKGMVTSKGAGRRQTWRSTRKAPAIDGDALRRKLALRAAVMPVTRRQA